MTEEVSRPAAVGQVEPSVRPRAAFEAWISGPPFEREVERFGENSAWPGNYRELDVDLAWQAWSAAMALARQRCAKLCDEVQRRYNDGSTGDDAAKACAAACRGGHNGHANRTTGADDDA